VDLKGGIDKSSVDRFFDFVITAGWGGIFFGGKKNSNQRTVLGGLYGNCILPPHSYPPVLSLTV
jgi:hypothetical protein